ncbi:MAG: ATP-binding protein, partial [Prevotella sp.]
MTKNVKDRGAKNHTYNASLLMGIIYAVQGNTYVARNYFLKALEEAKDQPERNKIQIYKELANLEMDDDPDKAMDYMEQVITIIKNEKLRYHYSDAIAFKAIIAFSRKDWDEVKSLFNEYISMKEKFGKEFSTTYMQYAQLCYYTAIGEYTKAFEAADSMTNTDKYKMKSKIYEVKGDYANAYYALQKLIREKDSVNSINIMQDINTAATELDVAVRKVKADEEKTIRLGMCLVILVAMSIIIMLVLGIRNRNKYLKVLKQKNHDLETLRIKSEESERMKASIIKNMSHEVRTPLNIISGFSQIISRNDLNLSDEERNDIAERVTESSNNIVKIINDLLFVASKEAVDYTNRSDSMKCNEMLRKAVADCRKILPENISISYKTEVDDSFTIVTNENGVSRILDSLLDNARKFTENGSIEVTCQHKKHEGMVEISVIDTGCTISTEQSEKIFDLFYKADNNKEGLGVGLPLALRIANQLGGQIILDMKYSGGTRFVLSLPDNQN